MPELLPLLRSRYLEIAKDLLAPFLEVLRVGRDTFGGDLDKLTILLVVAMRTAEHKDIVTVDVEGVLNGDVEVFPSLSTNVRSIADSTGIPKETVRRKVAALVEDGWIRRQDHQLSLAPHASRNLTALREELLQLALRNQQTVTALRSSQELRPPQDR